MFKRMKASVLITCWISMLLVSNACTTTDPASNNSITLHPTEAANLVWQELYSQPDISQQKEIVEKYFSRVPEQDEETRDRLIMLALGEEAFLTFDPKKALQYYDPLRNGDDLIAQHAWDRAMQIQFRAFENTKLVSGMIIEYRKRFRASELNTRWLFQQTGNFMELHFAKGESDKAIDYLLAELESLPSNAPYYSYGLVVQYAKEIEASGRANEVRSVVEGKVIALKKTQQFWKNDEGIILTRASEREQMPHWYWWMQRIPEGESIRSARLRQMNQLIPAIEARIQ